MTNDSIMESLDGNVYDNLPHADNEMNDWSYTMRRQMQEICPGIYLGPYACAAKNKLEALKASGITHLICIRHVMESNIIKPNFPHDFSYMVLDVADNFEQNIIQFLPKTREFIDNALQSQGKVVIHGNAGISRSAAIVIGYVMEKFGLTYKDAFQYVQSKRFCVNPNNHFIHQLSEYEVIYRARLSGKVTASDPGQSKRKYEELDHDLDDYH